MEEDNKLLLFILALAGGFVLAVLVIAAFIFIPSFFARTPVMPMQVPPSSSQAVPSPTQAIKCVISGCSKQLCVEEGKGDGISTCEWTEEYSCYSKSFAKCERQDTGKCGWTQNDELKSCITEARAKSSKE